MMSLTEYFETPAMLLHLGLVAAIVALMIVARQKRQRTLADWPGILRQSEQQRQRVGRYRAIRIAGLCCLVVALAGPRGSAEKTPTLAGRRDVMLVLDVSRSMNAEQPSRLEKAVRSLRTLTDNKRLPQGTRVGLVVFAARPWLAFPLTTDFAHLDHVLDRIESGEIPPEVRAIPNTLVSGTRIGAALKTAVDHLPTSSPQAKEIVLLSDGDDPVVGDEWQQGVSIARPRGIPVTVVAVGEPGVAATIPNHGDVLRFEGTIVKTEVQRDRLADIARLTGGASLTLDRGELPLASLLAKRWSEMPAVEVANDPHSVVEVRPARRAPWLLAALVAFVVAEYRLCWPTRLPWKLSRTLFAAFACLTLAAANTDSAGQSVLRRGQDAFARRDFAAALRFFEEAQPLLDDPGLAAFNRAAAHFRLGNFADAARAYRQTLDDDAIPKQRRDRARFDLGNSLLHHAGTANRRLLLDAIAAYNLCLTGDPDSELKRNAEFNLDIAARRLAALNPDGPPPRADPKPPTNDGNPKSEDPANPKKSGVSASNDPPNKSEANDPSPPDGEDSPNKAPSLGPITVLPDDAETIPMTLGQAAAMLDVQARRIADDRRRQQRTRDVASPQGKDW